MRKAKLALGENDRLANGAREIGKGGVKCQIDLTLRGEEPEFKVEDVFDILTP